MLPRIDIGVQPNKMTFDLETDENGENKMVFKGWYTFRSDEEFKVLAEGTKEYVKVIMENYAHLNLDVQFEVTPSEKAMGFTYIGKNIRPAISGIVCELISRLVTNEKEALKTLYVLFQVVKVCAEMKVVAPNEKVALPKS